MTDATLTLVTEPAGAGYPPGSAPEPDSGLVGLVMLARFHNIAADADQLAHDFREPGQRFGVPQILLAAKQLGLKAKKVATDAARLSQTPLPALAIEKDGSFVILARVDEQKVLIQDPRVERPQVLSFADFETRWSGELILLTSRASLAGDLAKFDFSWFIPAVVKYRKLLGEVLLVSFVLQLFALVTPLFFQVVMDKVLVHRGMTTLDVIAVGLLVVMLFEVALSGIRSHVFAHTTSRIDVELGARLFRHLLNLPLAYFQARRVGDTVARVRELENIRQFLTGNSITLVLDLLFSVVFIAVMLVYSGWLTLVVVRPLPCYLIALGRHHAAPARAPAREVQPRRREPGLPGRDHQRHRHRQGHGRRTADDAALGQAARRLRRRRLSHRDPGHAGARRASR
jgi:subfamily B ATP-binding cassette protein HlyB/CyaB